MLELKLNHVYKRGHMDVSLPGDDEPTLSTTLAHMGIDIHFDFYRKSSERINHTIFSIAWSIVYVLLK